ncbi:hypothetical protein BRDID11002_52350 [Bradyrhizobium diazoefficiens]
MRPAWTNVKRIDAAAQNVAKFVFDNGTAVAEAVLYKYPDYATRTVICCSTQSGCPVGCRFCGAGDNFVRSLSTDEIIAQVEHSIEQTGIQASEMKRLQIMFMSMGEPLLNLKGLVPALRQLYRMYPNAALLISTSAPIINYEVVREISMEIPTIGLQFSVHESTDAARGLPGPVQEEADPGSDRRRGRRLARGHWSQPVLQLLRPRRQLLDRGRGPPARSVRPARLERDRQRRMRALRRHAGDQ